MARARFDNLDPAKQESILSVAAQEFAENGYSKASVNRIIEAAGLSKGSLYYYFEDKSDLFSTVLERAITRLLEAAGWFDLENTTPENFWDTTLEMTHRAMALAGQDEWWVQLGRAYHRFMDDAEDQEAVQRLLDFGRDWWSGLVERGQSLGVIRNDLPLSLLVDAAVAIDNAGHRWLTEHWEELPPEEFNRVVEGWVDLMRDMLDKNNEGWER